MKSSIRMGKFEKEYDGHQKCVVLHKKVKINENINQVSAKIVNIIFHGANENPEEIFKIEIIENQKKR